MPVFILHTIGWINMKNIIKVTNLKISKRIVKISTYIAFYLLIMLIFLFASNMNNLYYDNIFQQCLENAVILSHSSDITGNWEKTGNILNETNINQIYIVEKKFLNYGQEYRYSYTYNLSKDDTAIEKNYVLECINRVFETGQPCTSKEFMKFPEFNRSAVGVAPLMDENNNFTSVICVEIPLGFGFPYIKTWQAFIYGIIFIIVLLCILFSFRFSRSNVIQPFEKIVKYAKTLLTTENNIEYDENNAIDIIVHAVDNMKQKQARLDESLEYAKAIQSRLLTKPAECKMYFNDFDVWWYPLAVVSGDFYKVNTYPKGKLIIMGDCTGHGIPGALMTMMVNTIIENSIVEEYCDDTRNILWTLDKQLSVILNKQRSENDTYITHGLDIITVFIGIDNTIKISSAGIHFFIVSDNGIEVIRGQRLFIGDGKIENKRKIKTYELKGNNNYSYYMASDGIFEQLGGEKNIPFGYSKFKKIIFNDRSKNISKVIENVKDEYFAYKGDFLRLDDVTIIGFRL